ncbi:MAG: MobP3 family relaxase, partial [Lachnospiraceae bacterium]
MPFSPIISKIRCHNPNKTGSRCANRNYAHYIATREGVDLSAINSIDDVISLKVYPDNDSTEKLIYIEADNHTYASYIANRPRSHGMFGNIDSTDLSSICATMEHLTTQHRNIYRGIVSLSEKDAKLLGMCDKSSWENYLHSVLPDIAKTLGVSPTDFTWVAAFHAEESHPHVHYMLWDNRDRVCSPFIHISKQKHCRTILADNLFTKEYEKLIRELTKTERNEISPIKNESRNTIIHTFKDVFDSIPDYVPGTISDKLPSRISNALLNTLSVDLEKLISELPGSGSFKYQYMTPDIKKTINQISDKLYTHLDLKKELDTYLSSSEKLGQLIGEDTEDLKHRKSRDINDIYTRTGNIILKCTKILLEQYALEGIAAGDFSKSNKDPLSEAATNFQIDNIPPPEEVSINNNIGNERESDYFDVHSKNSDNYHDVDIDVDAGIEINQFENSNISFPSNDTNIYSTTKHYHNAYFFDWTPNYKKALDLLYNKNFSNYEFVTKLLFSEVQKKNVLAIYEIGKLRNKKLLPDSAPELAQIYYKKALEGFLEIF